METITTHTVTRNLKAGVYNITSNTAATSSEIWDRFGWVRTGDKDEDRINFIACKVSVSLSCIQFMV